MTILDLKDQIMHKKLKNFYIFTGEEIGIINIYLTQMSKVSGLPITRAESVASIYDRCTGGSLFGDDLGFYVIRDDKDFMKSESIYDISKTIGKNIIVVLYEKIDSRLKFGKQFKDDIVAFEKLTPSVLSSYIKKEIGLSEDSIEKLMQICGYSYDMCMLEIDKIKQYGLSGKHAPIMPDSAFIQLLDCGAIYQQEETDVFKFVEAVCSRNIKEALKLEIILRENGVPAINILGTLYNSMKAILLIQCCDSSDICKVTGLDRGAVYYNKKYCGKFNTGDLVFAVKLLLKVISGIKSGYIEDGYATRYTLARIL